MPMPILEEQARLQAEVLFLRRALVAVRSLLRPGSAPSEAQAKARAARAVAILTNALEETE